MRTPGSLAVREQSWLRFLLLTVVLLAGMLSAAVPHAQETAAPERVLDVGVYVSPPFVMEEDGAFSGMAIELWEGMAANRNVESNYIAFETLKELVDATEAGDVDIAVTNLTITKGRHERINFTQPWFDAGLRIMVNTDQGVGAGALFTGLIDAGHLQAYGWLALVIVVATVLFTLFDRRFDPDFPRRWRDGIADSFYSVMSIATSGRPVSRKNLFGWVGRIWAAFWLICGIAVLSYVTASVTSVMTTLSLTNQIRNLDDLADQRVGVATGSTAEAFAREMGLRFRTYPHIDEAVVALTSGQIAAIIGDAPVLEYFQHTNPDVPVDVVGPIFEPDKYGFGVALRSPLLRPLTIELLAAKESDLIEEMRAKYFGEGP